VVDAEKRILEYLDAFESGFRRSPEYTVCSQLPLFAAFFAPFFALFVVFYPVFPLLFQKTTKNGSYLQFCGKWKKKAVPKRATVKELPFPTLFRALFDSLSSPFHAAWVLISFLKDLTVSKRTGVNFSGFYSTLSARHEKKAQRGEQKGSKKADDNV
jgi:hypothetical protein